MEAIITGFETALTSAITGVTGAIADNLPAILGVSAALVAVGVVWGIFRGFVKKK